jgi:multifunctional methyltransferase subunit TRM112
MCVVLSSGSGTHFLFPLVPSLWLLFQAAKGMGIPTLPPSLTEELVADNTFLLALYHVLMNVHLVQGVLTCPVTGREFSVQNEIPNMVLEEEECEVVRF